MSMKRLTSHSTFASCVHVLAVLLILIDSQHVHAMVLNSDHSAAPKGMWEAWGARRRPSVYTEAQPKDERFWKEAGKVVVRYDDWSKGNRTPRWTLLTPWDTSQTPAATTASISVAGDYVFTVE